MNKSKVLIVGGAGYIGSHMAKYLSERQFQCVILDNLSTGHAKSAKFGSLIIGDLNDQVLLDKLFKDNEFAAVLHFAAASIVAESVVNPSKYYRNNVSNTLNLLDAMISYGVKKLIFSSTAAIFGEPEYIPIDETHPKNPINPYGKSKLMVETILKDYFTAYGLNSVCLRYFNACGADPTGELGELHNPETHLIPIILQTASGRRKNVNIYGQDYPTIDGTCVRDYIHIEDLCQAHYKALEKMINDSLTGQSVYNLGNGSGYTVKEIIEQAQAIVGRDNRSVKAQYVDRRIGDPAVLVADASAAQCDLGWKPEYSNLNQMITHAWLWEKKSMN